MTCQRYYETFKNKVEVIEHWSGAVSEDTGLVDAELIAAGLTHARATQGQLRDAEHAAKERTKPDGALETGSTERGSPDGRDQ
jgi:hypothetical protein